MMVNDVLKDISSCLVPSSEKCMIDMCISIISEIAAVLLDKVCTPVGSKTEAVFNLVYIDKAILCYYTLYCFKCQE